MDKRQELINILESIRKVRGDWMTAVDSRNLTMTEEAALVEPLMALYGVIGSDVDSFLDALRDRRDSSSSGAELRRRAA